MFRRFLPPFMIGCMIGAEIIICIVLLIIIIIAWNTPVPVHHPLIQQFGKKGAIWNKNLYT